MIGARTPIYAIGTLHHTVFTECRRSGLFSFYVFMFLVSLFFISNALYLTPSTFCYSVMHIMYSYFDIMHAYYHVAILYIDDILRCFGGIEYNSLAHLIWGNQNIADNGVFDSIKQTKYIDNEDVEEVLNINENDFIILSLNCQSRSAKIDSLKVLINQINNQHKLSAICLQEK